MSKTRPAAQVKIGGTAFVCTLFGLCCLAADHNWSGQGGDNRWANPQNWVNNVVPAGNQDVVYFPAGTPTAVLIEQSMSIKAIYFRNPGMKLTVASGANLHFDNSGVLVLRGDEDAEIDGDGTLTFSDNGGTDFANTQAASDKTLKISAKITGNGFEFNGGGGIIWLANNNNDYTNITSITGSGLPGFLRADTMANTGVACAIGKGSELRLADANGFFYGGTGGSCNRLISQVASTQIDAMLRHGGTGTLTLTGEVKSGNNNGHAFIVQVDDPAAVIDMAGRVSDGGTGGLWFYKDGPGMLLFSHNNNTWSGDTLIREGTLAVRPTGTLGPNAIVKLQGGRLLFNAVTPATSFTTSIGSVTVENTLSIIEIAAGATSGTVNLGSFSVTSGLVDIRAPNLGGNDKIFITGQPDIRFAPTVTINDFSDRAAYLAISGVVSATLTDQNLAALGPSTIQDDTASAARINSTGASGGINLAANPTTVGMLAQETATDAIVALGGYKFVAPYIKIASGSANLTIGSALNDGTLTSSATENGMLVLDNSDTVNNAKMWIMADIGDNDSDKVRLVKSGPGDVILQGAIGHTEGTTIGEGTLIVENNSTLVWPSGGITGSGNLHKKGDGVVEFPNVANSYAGTTTVERGTLSLLHGSALGNTAGPTVVLDGGALNFVGTGDQSLSIGAEQVYAQGAGPDGEGAIRNDGTYSQYNSIRYLTLTDELTVRTVSRLDMRNYYGTSTLDLNGYGIVKKGSDLFGLTDVTVINDQGTSFFDILEGGLTLEVSTKLSDSSNYIRVRNGAYFDVYNLSSPMGWELRMDDGAIFKTRQGNTTNMNIMAGPVKLNGSVNFESSGVCSDTIEGNISGAGTLVKSGDINGITYLRNPTNSWSGGTTVANGVLYAAEPGALPNFATQVNVIDSGCLALRVADSAETQPGFTLTQIDSLLSGATFNGNNVSIGFDTAYESLDYTASLPQIGVRKFGANTLKLSGSGSTLGLLAVYGGTLDLTGPDRYLGDNSIYIGKNPSASIPLSTLAIGGTTRITTVDKGDSVGGQPVVYVGDNGRGVLKVMDDAFINARVIVGNAVNGAGAVHQSGGTVHNTGGAGNDGRIGGSGYGYYFLGGGTNLNNGYSQVGQALTGVGVLHIAGGSFVFTNSYHGGYGISRGGTGLVHMESGNFLSSTTFWIGDPSESDSNNGYACFNVTDDAEMTVRGSIDLGNRDNMTAMLNLRGGTTIAKRVWKANRTNTDALVNFNGGTLRVWNPDSAELFNGGVAGVYPDVTLQPGGAFIDVPETSMSLVVNTPLRKPRGLNLQAIPLVSGGSGYIGAPLVRIIGGGGKGAAAFAHVDLETGTVTSIEIVSSGSGYTEAPTVSLVGGGAATSATIGAPIMQMASSGGLTKLGDGLLRLNAVNTFTGPTEVRAGTLVLSSNGVIMPNSKIIVDGGTLNLNGVTISNDNVEVRSGAIINGAIASTVFNKEGSGLVTLGAMMQGTPTIAPLLTPGLWEGMVRATWDKTTPNPKTGLQLTPRAVIGSQTVNSSYAGGLWAGNNHTWIYSGYVWNRTGTNTTWSFRARFDDDWAVWIDGGLVGEGGNGSTTLFNATLTPGPHAIEMRFGDGSGDAGPAGEPFGIAYDPLGRGSSDKNDYQQMVDPGDGSLFTIDIPIDNGPGLAESFVHYNHWDITSDGVYLGRKLTTRAGNGSKASNNTYVNGIWKGENHTWIYKGYIWNRDESSKTWRWRFTFDDDVLLKIDDQLVRYQTLGSGIGYQEHTLTPGPHTIEIRFGDGVGDVGPADGLGGLTYDPLNRGSDDPNDYILLADAGDGALLTTDLATGEAYGKPPVEMTVVNVNQGTLLVKSVTAAPGLLEGRVSGSFNKSDENPATGIEYTTTAANGICDSGGSINGKHWPDNSTYIYTGYIWNRTNQHVTWTFAENFDDSVLLKIDDVTYIDNSAWDTITKANVTLTPGPHKFEVRFGQGGGGAGRPNDGNAGWFAGGPGSFLVDYQGRNSDTLANYTVPVDPGDGSLFTINTFDSQSQDGLLSLAIVNVADGAVLDLDDNANQIGLLSGDGGTVSNGILSAQTVISPAGDRSVGELDFTSVSFASGVICRVTIDGAQSDCLRFDGVVDLSGLTVVPATDAELTENKYVIASATTGFIGAKPMVDGFPSKYKIMRRGTELLLTREGGAVLMLR